MMVLAIVVSLIAGVVLGASCAAWAFWRAAVNLEIRRLDRAAGDLSPEERRELALRLEDAIDDDQDGDFIPGNWEWNPQPKDER